jgi:hypothetical protein
VTGMQSDVDDDGTGSLLLSCDSSMTMLTSSSWCLHMSEHSVHR